MAERLSFGLLALVLVLAPLPYGAVEDWAWMTAAMLIALAVLMWAVGCFLDPPVLQIAPAYFAAPAILFGVVLIWIFVQQAPFTPASWHHPAWHMAEAALRTDLNGAISVDPYATRLQLYRYCAYTGVFFLSMQLGRNRRLAAALIHVLILSIAVHITLGLGAKYLAAGQMPFYDFTAQEARYGGRFAYPFFNPNHLAAYAGMGLLLIIGLFNRAFSGRGRSGPGRTQRNEATNLIYLGFLGCIIVTGLALTLSRGGAASLIAGITVFMFLLARRTRRLRHNALPILTILASIVLGVFVLGSEAWLERLALAFTDFNERLEIYEGTRKAIIAAPFTGYGAGTFSSVARLFLSGDSAHISAAAHNSYLENALELGIPAAICLFTSIALVLMRCLKGAERQSRNRFFSIAAAIIGAQLAVHSVIDFPLQIPAIAMVFAAISGVGFAQSYSSRKKLF